MRILVFDDDLVHHREFLAPLAADFIYRAHADNAVADVLEVKPDVVFMDYSMGRHLRGEDAVKLLREVWDYDALPIIGISSDAHCNKAMCRAGATEGLVKMSVPDRFEEIVGWCTS